LTLSFILDVEFKNMSGFTLRKRISGPAKDVTLLEIIGANSVVIQKGDVIRVNTSGFGALFVAGDLVLGVVAGVVTRNGVNVAPDSGTLDTWTLTSDNQTDDQYKIQYIPAIQDYLFYNDSDDTLAQTNLFQYFPLNDENDVDGSNPSDSTLNTVRLVQIDPDGDGDASKGLFQFVETFWAQNCGGTVDTSGIEA